MIPYSEKANLGMVEIGALETTAKRTIIVVGHGRSGTSLCSAALNRLEIFTGDGSHSPVFEDTRLSTAIERSDVTMASRIINEYNERHSIWAYKRPSLLSRINQYHSLFRNPFYLFVFRDPLAIACRAVSAGDPDLYEGIARALASQKDILNFIRERSPNGLLLSFEKIIAHRKVFVERLAQVCRQTPTPQAVASAIDAITKTHAEYLAQVSASAYRGHLDLVGQEKISGWACKAGETRPQSLLIRINGNSVASVTAGLPRPDVFASGLHSTESCGFEWQPKRKLSTGDSVEVVFEETQFHLNGSPKRFVRQ